MPTADAAPPAPSMTPADIVERKRIARARAVEVRRAAFLKHGHAAALALRDRLLESVLAASFSEGATGAYCAMGDELDPLPLLEALAAKGHALALPVVLVKGQPLIFRRWSPGGVLEAGRYGTRHPEAGAEEVRPSLLFVPLLAFDRDGFRLGYGGGYYDRTLEKLRKAGRVTAVGIGFSAQEVPAVPRDPHDQPLDWIATEKEVTKVNKA